MLSYLPLIVIEDNTVGQPFMICVENNRVGISNDLLWR